MARPQSGLDRRIVEQARARFLVEGVDGASLRQIAKDAGTNIGMVYYYFPTKDDLFLAVIEEVYEGFLLAMQSLLSSEIEPDERIERIYTRIAMMTPEEFDVIRLIVREALVSSTRLGKIAERFRAGHLPVIFQMILEGLGKQTFRQDLPPVAILASMMALGIFPQLMRRIVLAADLPVTELIPSAERSAQVMHGVLLRGIGGPNLGAHAGGELLDAAAEAPSESPRSSGPLRSKSSTPGKSATPSKTKKSR